jgi:zinc protease
MRTQGLREASGILLFGVAAMIGPASGQSVSLKIEDSNHDGAISRKEFLSGAPEAQREAIDAAFAKLDCDGNGVLSGAELRALAERGTRAHRDSKPHAADDEIGTSSCTPAQTAIQRGTASYAVVMSAVTAADPGWKAVATALVKKHGASLVTYSGSVTNALEALQALRPRYTAFVTRPEVLGRIYVARVHRLTRRLDDDPYTDTLWGIVCAGTPDAARRMAVATEPAVVRSALTLTGVDARLYDDLLTISDGKPGDYLLQRKGREPVRGSDGNADRVNLFVTQFQGIQPDAIVGSGHATERNLEMCFSKGNTEIRDGKWYGLVHWREPVLIPPDGHGRVFLGAGNCLIGNFQRRADSMAAVLTGSYDFNQFVGYTVPTWYGKGGWGTLSLWDHLAGRHSLGEAWFFNNQVITHELNRRFPELAGRELPISDEGEGLPDSSVGRMERDASGMLWDRDVVAFYGDPAFRVVHDPSKLPCPVQTDVKREGNRWTVAVRNGDPAKGAVHRDQPLCLVLPSPAPGAKVIEGERYEPLVKEHYLMLFKPDYRTNATYKVIFTSE